MSLTNFHLKRLLSFTTLRFTSLTIRDFSTSSLCNYNKLGRTPYPWKNLRNQDPKYQYTSQKEDSDLTDDNKDCLLEKRLELSMALNEERKQILKTREWPRNEYVPHKTQRCGLIGYKIGLMPHWTKTGKRISVTLYQVMDNVALNYIPATDVENLFQTQRRYMRFKDDYPTWVTQRRWGLQFVGAIAADPGEFNSSYSGLFTKYGVTPRRKLARFLVSEDAALQPGMDLSIQHFRLGDRIDVTARTTNHGFEGVMLRHDFKGGKKTHGCTKTHRRPGAISHGVKVLRGKRLPGVWGNVMRTIRGIQIVRMDYKHNILYLSGITPGPIHSYAHLCDTWIKYRINERSGAPAMPTTYETDEDWIDWTERNDDDYLDIIHRFDDPTIQYKDS